MSVHELEAGATDIITAVRFSPDNSMILATSWDGRIYQYSNHSTTDGNFKLICAYDTGAPVLDICFNSDGTAIYIVGLRKLVTEYGLDVVDMDGQPSLKARYLSKHGKASNKVAFSSEHNLLVSISWDETMHVHDASTGQYVPIKLAAKPFALALSSDKAVVSMVERRVHVYSLVDLKKLVEQAGNTTEGRQPLDVKPWQERESSLKFMTRASGCMPDGTGFASSSIEGRVGVEWFDEEANKKSYAFKCHRDKTTTTNEEGQEVPVDIIYPVNGLAFHPVYGTFATGGGDGVVALWDANTKRRVRQWPKLCSSVASLDFSPDGNMIAIGVSPGFEDAKAQDMPDPELVRVFVRTLADGEAKGKPAKEK